MLNWSKYVTPPRASQSNEFQSGEKLSLYISGYSFLLLINNKYTLTTSSKNQMCRPKQICHPEFKTILPCGCCPCKYQISNRYASVAELVRYSKSTGHRLRFLPNSTPGEGPIKISFERLPEQASKDQPSRTRSRNTPRTSTPRISAPRISTPRTFTRRAPTPRTSTPKKPCRAWWGTLLTVEFSFFCTYYRLSPS